MSKSTGTIQTEGKWEILHARGGPTPKQLESWTNQGFLKPVVDHVDRAGREWRSWPHEERVVAVVMARLVAAGFRTGLAESTARSALAKWQLGVPLDEVCLTLTSGVVLTVKIPELPSRRSEVEV